MSDAQAPPVRTENPRSIWIEALGFWLLTAVSIRLAVQLHAPDDLVAVIKALALIYLPLGWMFRTHRDLARYGLHAGDFWKSLALFAVVSVVTLVPFWLGNHFFATKFLHQRYVGIALPANLAVLIASEVFSVALPEEVFYRGYLQSRLDEALSGRVRILGASVGWALPIASVIFVAGHLAVRPALWELAIFFPSLVFGWLRARSGSLVAPVLYHALCNVGMIVVQSGYR